MVDTKGTGPTAAARILGVHPNTLRLWCAQYARLLSPTANPPDLRDGGRRTLTDADIATLSHVREYTSRGLTAAETLETLEAMAPQERHAGRVRGEAVVLEGDQAPVPENAPVAPTARPGEPPAVAQPSVNPEIAAWALAGVRSELVSALREAIGDEVRAAVADASTAAEVAQRRGFIAGTVAGAGAVIAAIGAAWAWWGR